MKNYLTGKILTAQWKMRDYAEKFLTNEEGDTNFVSIMLIIVIVVGLAAVFQKQLGKMAEAVMDKLFEFINK